MKRSCGSRLLIPQRDLTILHGAATERQWDDFLCYPLKLHADSVTRFLYGFSLQQLPFLVVACCDCTMRALLAPSSIFKPIEQ